MRLPFGREEFLDLFAVYNAAAWPAVIALWLISVLTCVRVLSSRRPHDRWISGLLTVHWAWAAVAYHAALFTRINPAAWLFAALFLVQAALFFWLGVIKRRLCFTSRSTGWRLAGSLFMVYALVYPAFNAVQHDSILRIPTFGVPCPTTIFTIGLLLLSSPRSKSVGLVPIIWSAIGGSAAFLLGVSADYALPIAGAALAVFQWQEARRPTSSSGLVTDRKCRGHGDASRTLVRGRRR